MADIRPYQPRDRQAVHAICRATIYGGAERLRPPDPDLFAELMIRYYTDFTPETVWVAERRGRVVGYLAGCFDEEKLRRVMVSRIAPRAVARSLGRGLLLRPPLWRQLAVLPRFLAAERRADDVDLSAYPAHLHVNLLPEARGRRLGERLVEELFVEATRRGVPGVHATVLEDNRGGRRFFERLGFAPLFRRPVLRPPSREERLDEKIVYVRSLPAD